MASLMSKGYGISLVISSPTGGSHAITAWGYDYLFSNLGKTYTAVWITDSDDKIMAMRRLTMAYDTTKGWYLTSGYIDWRISGVYAFGRNAQMLEAVTGSIMPLRASGDSLPGAPIMPSWTLVGTGLLALLMWRKRQIS